MSAPIAKGARSAVLFVAIVGLLFDGVELGLMRGASLFMSENLLGDALTTNGTNPSFKCVAAGRPVPALARA